MISILIKISALPGEEKSDAAEITQSLLIRFIVG